MAGTQNFGFTTSQSDSVHTLIDILNYIQSLLKSNVIILQAQAWKSFKVVKLSFDITFQVFLFKDPKLDYC